MPTRTVTGPILGPVDNQPLANFALRFTVTEDKNGRVQYTNDGHYPWHEVTIETDANGDFALDLVTGIRYQVWFDGAIMPDRRIRSSPPGVGAILEFVVPPGETPISLQTIRALGSVDPEDPTVAQIIEDAIQAFMDNNDIGQVIENVDTHLADLNNPHQVTAAQVGLGNVADLAPDELPVSTATQTALDDVTDALGDTTQALIDHEADTSNPHGVTAAQAGAYTTGQVDTLVSGVSSDLTDHISDTDNPHGVTAAQTGAYTTSQTDSLLSAKANTADLGTAAAADTDAFATAAQGSLADTAVQPSEALADAIDQRHEHDNKDTLDTVTPELLVPGGGVRGQVLTVGDGGERGWGERPHSPPLRRGWYALTSTHGLGRRGNFTTLMIPAGRLVLAPLELPLRTTWTYNQISVTTASAAGSLLIGVFDYDPETDTATLIASIANVSTATTGFKITSGLSLPLGPGWYWMGVLPDEDVTVRAYDPVFGIGGSVTSPTTQSWIRLDGQAGPFSTSYSGFSNQDTGSGAPDTGLYRG